MRKIKRITSIILAALMVMSLFAAVPMTVNAAPPSGGGGGGTGTGIGGTGVEVTPTTTDGYIAEEDYLTFTALEDDSSVKVNFQSGSNFKYKKNNNDWQDFEGFVRIELNKGESVRLRGSNTVSYYNGGSFSIRGKVAASGNIMSLRLDSDSTSQGLATNCFHMMFAEGCDGLITAPELPETTLAEYCYEGMFENCRNLTTAPALPATTLELDCYSEMFSGCTSLTELPALPATSLAHGCYHAMFNGCTSLTELPALPATTLVYGCYYAMFRGCSNIRISNVAGTYDGIKYSEAYRIPTEGTATNASDAVYGMFAGTGGKFTGTPNINTTYYIGKPVYTVTWNNWNDTELETDTEVESGAAPTFNGTTPEKAEDETNTYTFSGWSDGTNTYGLTDTLPNVTADVTYTAQFTAVPKPKKLTLNVGENGKVVMDNGTFGNATDASNIVEVQGPIDVADETKVSIVEGHSLNLVEGGSVNIATGGEVSLYPSADNTGVITAIPAEGYVFAGWYNGDTLYSSAAALSYQNISENITLTASFTAHDPHSFENDPTFNWSQDASTGDWDCDTLTLSCSCGATQDTNVAGVLGATNVKCTADANGDFTYKISKKISGVTYEDTKTLDANGVVKSVTQLKAAAAKGGSWELGNDIDRVINVKCANGFVLDGKNKTVTRPDGNSNYPVFVAADKNAGFTLKNLTIDGVANTINGKPAIASSQKSGNSGDVINLDNVTITNWDFDASNNGAILAYGYATVNMTNCNIDTDSDYDVWGGAASTVNVSGGEVGTVYLHGGTATAKLTNGADVDNIVAFAGNTITADSGSNITPPADYKVKDNGDGTYSIVPKEYVAQVNDGQKYETLAEAITAAEDGDTITVLADTDVAYASIANKSITIDATGHTVTGGQYHGMNVPMFVVKSTGGLTLAGGTFTNAGDSVVNNNGTLVVDGATLNGDAFGIYNGGNLTISSGSVSGKQNSVNNAKANATTTITGGSFTGKLQNTAGEIAVSGGTFSNDVDIYAAPGFVGTQLSATTFGVKVDTNPLGLAPIIGFQKKITGNLSGNDIDTQGVRIVTKVEGCNLNQFEEYGYVVAKVTGKEQANANFNNLKAYGGNGEKTIKCNGSVNNIDGLGTPYVTLAVNGMNVGDQVAARFYAIKNGVKYYSNYVSTARYNGIIATY